MVLTNEEIVWKRNEFRPTSKNGIIKLLKQEELDKAKNFHKTYQHYKKLR